MASKEAAKCYFFIALTFYAEKKAHVDIWNSKPRYDPMIQVQSVQ